MPIPRCVAWIGLGSNLASPEQQVRRALRALAALPDARLLAESSLYRTTPVGGPPGQPDFCNACAAIVCDLTPLALLDTLQGIEAAHDRVRDVRWGPRTLDLDVLAFDSLRMTHPRLALPHPRIAERAFVLKPLADIAPTLVVHGARVIDHLRHVGCDGVAEWPAATGGGA